MTASPLAGLDLPADFSIESCTPLALGETTNSVYRWAGVFGGARTAGYLKVADRQARSLANEAAVLRRLAGAGIPVPAVLAAGDAQKQFLALSALPGVMLWDIIDPRRSPARREIVLAHVEAYGALLARIHALPIAWKPQPRADIEDLSLQECADPRFAALVAWLDRARPAERAIVFAHGDFNPANVLFLDGAVSGVVDWEFAGLGWREFELAWALRARTHFLNTDAEREALLGGYRTMCSYDEAHLRWCEVLTYLHFAAWQADPSAPYVAFALARARALAGR